MSALVLHFPSQLQAQASVQEREVTFNTLRNSLMVIS